MAKNILFKVFLLIIFSGCNSEYKNLEIYYKTKPIVHKELSDSLIEFCKKYKTEVTLHQSITDRILYFNVLNDSDATMYPIIFDSTLARNDPNPSKTCHFEISLKTMNYFKDLAYSSIRSDSTMTFFGGANHFKFQLGTHNDLQYGILISNQMNSCKGCFKELAANTWLTEGTIP